MAKTTKKSAKKSAKKSVKKAAAAKATGKTRQALIAQRPIVWSESRVAVVKAMRKLGATSATAAKTAAEIADKSGVDAVKVKVHCDAYRGGELIQHGYAASAKHEGQRELVYHLTAKGTKTDFTDGKTAKKNAADEAKPARKPRGKK